MPSEGNYRNALLQHKKDLIKEPSKLVILKPDLSALVLICKGNFKNWQINVIFFLKEYPTYI